MRGIINSLGCTGLVYLASLLLTYGQTTRKPNILVILADDLGYSDLGCYGNRVHQTPHLDQLASIGKQFTQAYAAPVCSPSRAALLTGKSPAFLHLTEHLRKKSWQAKEGQWQPPNIVHDLPLDHTTVAEYLSGLDYTTAAFGKWHLGGEGYLPTNQGFDFALAGSRDGMPGSYYYPFSSKLFQLPELEGLGKPGDYLTDLLTDQAIGFLQKDHQQPFFLYLSYFAVHTPIQAKKDLAEKYRAAGDTSQFGADYAAMVENLDRNVGRVMDALQAKGYFESTMIVFASDNGGLATTWSGNPPVTDNAPLRSGKGSLYEGGIRVPFIIKHPQLTDTTTCHVPVILEDVFPTIIELTQSADKQLDSLELHGRSLLPLWKNADLPERSLFWHFPHYGNMEGSVPASAIRKGDIKLIRFYEDNRTELYNLKRDPGETANLLDDEPDLVAQLTKELGTLKQQMNAQEPTPPEGK